jgi:hypothetical protein
MAINDLSIASPKEKSPIFLVHGTWGRGILRLDPPTDPSTGSSGHRPKRWFEEGSDFRVRLEELKKASLDGAVRAFCWSGANSVTARDCAAKELSEELDQALRVLDVRPIIIAHSHGGNIVLCALKYLKAGGDRLQFIALATPFMRVYLRNEPLHRVVGAIGLVLMLALPIIVVGVLFTAIFLYLGLSTNLVAKLVGILLGVVLLLGIFLFEIARSYRANRPFNSENMRKIKEAASYRPKDLHLPEIFAIRGIDDEGTLALAMGSIGALVGKFFLNHILKIIVFAMIFAMFTVVPPAKFGWWTSYEKVLGIIFICLTYSSVLLCIVFYLLSGCCKMVFGREFLLRWPHFEIAVGTAPDASDGILTSTLPPIPGSGLRHSIYNHPDCVKAIVDWLTRPSRDH